MTVDLNDDVQWFHALCRAVLIGCKDEYAKAYAKAGLAMESAQLDLIKAQIPYILSNTAQWRGEAARITKRELKALQDKLR